MSIDALIKWYEDRKGKVSYSMAQRGDIFVAGIEGASLGAFGHTGVHYGNGKIIHCNGADNGISITPISGRTGSPCRWVRIKGNKPIIEGRTIHELAQVVIRGEFGVSKDRKSQLGEKYNEVQKLVSDTVNSDKVDIEALALAVIRGEYGTGEDRRKALGSNYEEVQTIVNELYTKSNQAGNNATLPTQDLELSYNGTYLSKKIINSILMLCKHYDIFPSFAILILHFENIWGYYKVGQLDNNWAGMTMTTDGLT